MNNCGRQARETDQAQAETKAVESKAQSEGNVKMNIPISEEASDHIMVKHSIGVTGETADSFDWGIFPTGMGDFLKGQICTKYFTLFGETIHCINVSFPLCLLKFVPYFYKRPGTLPFISPH